MTSDPRPLSPHLQVYRWQLTSVLSILHRASGAALYVGAFVLTGWTLALASGPDAFAAYRALMDSIPGKIVLFALTVAIFFHLANGVRHLAWDMGKGFALRTADATAWLALVFAVVAAAATWLIAAGGL